MEKNTKRTIKIADYKGKHKKAKKGLHLYIRENNKTHLYKIRKGEKIDEIIKRHNKKEVKKIKLQPPKNITPKKYLQKARKTKKISSTLKSGIMNITINNVLNTNTTTINKATKKLFSEIINDQQLLDMLITEENLKKIKGRLDYKIQLIGTNNETLGYLKMHNETPKQIYKKINEKLYRGKKIDFNYENQVLNQLGNYNFTQEGIIKQAKMTITFRKR